MVEPIVFVGLMALFAVFTLLCLGAVIDADHCSQIRQAAREHEAGAAKLEEQAALLKIRANRIRAEAESMVRIGC